MEDPSTLFLQEMDGYWVEVGIRKSVFGTYFLDFSGGYQLETVYSCHTRITRISLFFLTRMPLQDGVLSEREFKKFFECFLRYAFFDVVSGPGNRSVY